MKYAYSTDEENYHGKFDSPEEAAAECFSNDGDTRVCYVGEVDGPQPPETYIDAQRIIEHIQEQDDYNMECAHDWPGETVEQRAELEGMLARAFRVWMRKHKLEPTHFTIRNPRRMTRSDTGII